MSRRPNDPNVKRETTHVRYNFPEDVMTIIRKHRRKLAVTKDQDFSVEEAVIDLIRSKKEG